MRTLNQVEMIQVNGGYACTTEELGQLTNSERVAVKVWSDANLDCLMEGKWEEKCPGVTEKRLAKEAAMQASNDWKKECWKTGL